MHPRTPLLALALAAVATGCPAPNPPTDGATDGARPDALAQDARPDAPADTTVDAPNDAPPDAAPADERADAAPDATTDVTMDATADASPADATRDASPVDALAADAPDADASPADAAPFDAASLPANWRCVGGVVYPRPTIATHTVTVRATSYVSRAPIAGLTVRACARADLTCAAPLATGTSSATGDVMLTVPLGTAGFDGYIEFTGGDVQPTRAFVFPPLVESVATISPLLLRRSEVTAFAAVAGVTLDPARGHAAFTALDCMGTPGSGVAVEVAPAPTGAQRFYLVGMLPSTTATATDATGTAGFLNVPEGSYTITARLAAPGVRTGSLDVSVRTGFFTSFVLPPTP